MGRIGWVGTGVMGTAIVKRLLAQNTEVMVFNRTTAKARPLLEEGAVLADSPRAIAQACTTIFLSLTGQEALEHVIFGSQTGIVAAGIQDISIIDTSTISPAFAISLSTRLQSAGIAYIDAPVSGGPENARLGRLGCVISGSELSVERSRDVLAKFTASVHYVGASGNAQLIKVINNLAESINLMGAAEVLSIGQKAGIDIQTLQTVLPTLRGYSTYMGVLLDRLVNPREDISFALATRLKDLRLAHQIAADYAVPTLVGTLVEQLFALALQQEGPRADQTTCIRLYQERAHNDEIEGRQE